MDNILRAASPHVHSMFLSHRVPKKYPSCARSQEVEDTTSSIALASVGCKPERASPIRIATPGSWIGQHHFTAFLYFADVLDAWEGEQQGCCSSRPLSRSTFRRSLARPFLSTQAGPHPKKNFDVQGTAAARVHLPRPSTSVHDKSLPFFTSESGTNIDQQY